MSNKNTIFLSQSRIINNLKYLQCNNYPLKNSYTIFKNNKKKKINEYLDNKFNEYKENRIKKLKSCSNEIQNNNKKITNLKKKNNENNKKLLNNFSLNQNDFINEKNIKCKSPRNNSVNLDDDHYQNICFENYESPKFSCNKQNQLNLLSKSENKNQNKQIINNDFIQNNNINYNKIDDKKEHLKNQFIGENNLNKRNNINLISKENIQYKDKSFKSNSTNNLFEIPENKKQNSDLKLNKKTFQKDTSNFMDLLNKIRKFQKFHNMKKLKSNENNNNYTLSFQNNEMNDIDNLNRYFQKKVPPNFYNSTYFKYISQFKNIINSKIKNYDKNNLILTNYSSYIKKYSCIMPPNPYESILEARENSFFNI